MGTHVPSARDLVHARFLPFFVTQLLTAFNDNVFKNALVMFALTTHQTAFGLGESQTIFLLHGLFVLPFFLFSAMAGQLADKHDKSRVIVLVKAAELAIMSLAAAGFFLKSFPALLLALAAMGVHSAVLGPAKYGILPELLTTETLVIGNAWVELGTFLAILLGTLTGSLAQTDAGIQVVAAFVFVLAGLGFGTSLRIPAVAPANPSGEVGYSLIGPTVEVLRIAFRTRSLFHTVLAISWFWFVGACLLELLPIYTREGLGAQTSVVVWLQTVFCVGIAFGSLLTERISGPNLELALVPIGAFGMSAALLALWAIGLHPSDVAPRDLHTLLATDFGPKALAALAVVAISGGFFTVPLYAFLAKRSPSDVRARVIAANNVLNALFMVASAVLLMVLEANHVPLPTIFLGLAVATLLVALYVESVVPEYLLRFVAFLLSRAMYRLRVEGTEHIPKEGPAILVCNHVSFVDWLVIGGAVHRPVRFVMDHRIAKTPVASILFRKGKTIPIAPAKEDPETLERAFAAIDAELAEGELVCIFPEGRLTSTGDLEVLKPGVLRALEARAVPVVPMGLDGLWGSTFSRKGGPALSRPPRGFRARLRLSIGPAIPASEVTLERIEADVRRELAREPRLDVPTAR